MFPTLDDLKAASPRYAYGKIGSLPDDLRHELNRRIRNHELGTRLVAWLNSLPQVQAVLVCRFHGRPINCVNLAKWKATGYRQWRFDQKMQDAFELLAALPEDELTDRQINPAAKLTQKQTENRPIPAKKLPSSSFALNPPPPSITHTGKIGRLPEELQHQLNLRILAKTPDAQLLQWLNGLPETQAVLARDFSGQKITSRNLKAWKTGGYQHWVTEETAFLDVFERILSQPRTPSPPAAKLTPDSQINLKANQKPSDAGQFLLPLALALASTGQSKLDK